MRRRGNEHGSVPGLTTSQLVGLGGPRRLTRASGGDPVAMTEDNERAQARAEALVPEEEDAGTDDPLAQAAAILEESDAPPVRSHRSARSAGRAPPFRGHGRAPPPCGPDEAPRIDGAMSADRIRMAQVPRLRDQPRGRRRHRPGLVRRPPAGRERPAIRLEETKHVDRLYFPVDDVNWELFEPTPNFTICPFKGHATYWSLTAVDPVEKDIVWTYSDPFDEVGGIEGHVALLPGAGPHRDRGTLARRRPGAADRQRFPAWGDATDLLALIDVDTRRARTRPLRGPAIPRHHGATWSKVGRCSPRARRGLEDAAPPACDVGVDVLPEGGRRSTRHSTSPSTCCARAARSRPPRCASLQDDKLRSVGLYLARQRCARRHRRQRRDARRRRARSTPSRTTCG